MQNLGELAAAGLFGYLFYSMATMRVKNEGELYMDDGEGTGEVMPSTTELSGEKGGPVYGDASGIESRSPDDVCQVNPQRCFQHLFFLRQVIRWRMTILLPSHQTSSIKSIS